MPTDNSVSITESKNDANKDDIKKIDITINDEYKQLISQLTSGEYETLKKSIRESKGNVVPIIINQRGIILDGHHRFRVCKELGLDAKIEIKEFSDALNEREFIITINLIRRQLNSFQIVELGTKLEEIEKEKSNIRLSEAGKIGSIIRWNNDNTEVSQNKVGSIEPTLYLEEKGKTLEKVANKIGISPTIYFRARKIIANSSEEQKQRLREGKDRIDKVYKELQKAKKREKLVDSIKQSPNYQQLSTFFHKDNNDGDDKNNEFIPFKLLNGDFTEKDNEIPSESIDLIFTDPPYSSEFLPVYSELAILASRVLKPGGSLVTYFGQHNLPQVLELITPHLKYWWPIAVKHTGPTKAFHQRQVFVLWKPLLWFVKGEKLSRLDVSSIDYSDNNNSYLYDYIESKPPEKNLHPWEQSTVEAEYIIKKLTTENQIVLDPFMGSGTTGIATLNLNRKFIGIEKEDDKFKIAEARLANHFYTDKIDPVNLTNKLTNNHSGNENNDSIREFNLSLESNNKVELP